LFKKLGVLVFLLLLANSCFAAIFIVEPVDRKVQNGQSVALGKMARGETVRLIVRKKSDSAVEWDSISVEQELLPKGWNFESSETDKTLIALISSPADAEISTQRIGFTVGNKSQPLFSETFYGSISVREKLLTVTVENLNQEALVGQTAQFKLIANNDSIAEHKLLVKSDLPSYWFESRSITIPALSKEEVDLNVGALAYGQRQFRFTVSSLQNDTSFQFPASLSVKPTLRAKFFSGFIGLPFYSPSLFSQYLFLGFLAWLS